MEDGNEVIPFSAMRELYKYEAFVINIAPRTDIEEIKRHLKSKLCTENISIKIMTKTNAPSISFGLFIQSDSDKLDLKMPGLWPIGIRVYKWNTKAGVGQVFNQTARYQSRPNTHGTRGNNYNGRQNSAVTTYTLPYPDQQQLHNQNV